MAPCDDATIGFTRPEMYKEALAGTAKTTATRQLFLAWGKVSDWPAEIPNQCPDGSLPKLVDAVVKGKKAKLNIIEPSDDVKEGDVLVFPDYVRIRCTSASGPGLAALKTLLGQPPGGGSAGADLEDLGGGFVFVCSHTARDARCGHCGPELAEAFERAGAKSKGTKVLKCSHVGGHVYAGNVISYAGKSQPRGDDGHWYGYVTPDAAAKILSGVAARGPLWRGRHGLNEADAKKERQTQKLKDVAPFVVAAAAVAVVGVAFLLRRNRQR